MYQLNPKRSNNQKCHTHQSPVHRFTSAPTVVLLSSLYLFHGAMTTPIIQKTVLVCLAWLVFAVLLLGRHLGGWRGRKAVNGTLVGVALLIVAAFGIQLIH